MAVEKSRERPRYGRIRMLALLVLLALVVIPALKVSPGVAQRVARYATEDQEVSGSEQPGQADLEELLQRLDDSQRRMERAMGNLEALSKLLAAERVDLQDRLNGSESSLRASLAAGLQRGLDDVAVVKTMALENSVRLGNIELEDELPAERGKRLMIQPTVQLRGNGTVGSAVVVYSGPFDASAPKKRYCNLALTAFHVVAEVLGNRLEREIAAVKLFFPGLDEENRVITARLVAYDRAKDIALLSLGTDMELPGIARLKEAALLESMDIFSSACAVGCPLGSNPIATLGQITAVDKEVDGEKFWMINAPTYFGNSGGGVYSVPDCDLIGIFSMIYTYGKAKPRLVPHMGLFLPLQAIRTWLDSEGLRFVHDGSAVPSTAWKKMGYSIPGASPADNNSG